MLNTYELLLHVRNKDCMNKLQSVLREEHQMNV